MKNYELIQMIIDCPASAEVYFAHTVTREDMAEHDEEYIVREVTDVDSDGTSITLMG